MQVLFVGKHQIDIIQHKWVIFYCLQVILELIQQTFRIIHTYVKVKFHFYHLKFLLCFTNSLTVQAINNVNIYRSTKSP